LHLDPGEAATLFSDIADETTRYYSQEIAGPIRTRMVEHFMTNHTFQEWFDMVDADNSNKLSYNEFGAAVRMANKWETPITDERLAQLNLSREASMALRAKLREPALGGGALPRSPRGAWQPLQRSQPSFVRDRGAASWRRRSSPHLGQLKALPSAVLHIKHTPALLRGPVDARHLSVA
jgi:hypothetical protein